jgi:hypothetical protein
MGKRSNFERRPRDFYPTPREAVLPLVPHLRGIRRFAEPCAGAGDLVRHLEEHGLKCVYAGDIADGRDAFACESFGAPVITNPPWSRNVLHPLIAHFMQAASFAWLLFDADWAHTKQSTSLITYCSLIVPVGRLRWIPNSPHTGRTTALGIASRGSIRPGQRSAGDFLKSVQRWVLTSVSSAASLTGPRVLIPDSVAAPAACALIASG